MRDKTTKHANGNWNVDKSNQSYSIALVPSPPSRTIMKLLTSNFLKCSVKACDSSNDNFPLRYDANCQLQQDESIDCNPEFLINILQRVDWNALVQVALDLGNSSLPPQKPELSPGDDLTDDDLAIIRDMHSLLIQTSIVEGQMSCRNCGHVYYIKNGIPNLLLPPHLA